MKKVLLLTRSRDRNSDSIVAFCRQHFNVTHFSTDWDRMPPPEDVEMMMLWRGEYLLNYLSPWKVPQALLSHADMALNFHPGSPEYPGIGCVNWALYDNATSYGVTCHQMTDHLDDGPIFMVDRFPIYANDTVDSLLTRADDHIRVLFYEIVECLSTGRTLLISSARWGHRSTRQNLDDLATITVDMDEFEIARRIRATSYPRRGWQPRLVFRGHVFEFLMEVGM